MSALTNDKTVLCDELFLRIASGEQEAFRTLYQATSGAIYGYALSLLKNREDAEDVMQETYIRIRRYAAQYQEMGKPMAWILTITRNLACRKLEERQRISYLEIDEIENKLDFSSNPEMEQRLVLESAFQILSDQERQIIVLHAVGGMRYREISSMLHKPLSTVLSCYHRAVKKLRVQLQERSEL